MIVHFHLVINDRGSVRALINKPSLQSNEVSMQLQLTIPNAVFQRPQFKAELIIPDTAVMVTEIPVDLTDQVQQAIEQATGYEVKLSLVPAKEKNE